MIKELFSFSLASFRTIKVLLFIQILTFYILFILFANTSIAQQHQVSLNHYFGLASTKSLLGLSEKYVSPEESSYGAILGNYGEGNAFEMNYTLTKNKVYFSNNFSYFNAWKQKSKLIETPNINEQIQISGKHIRYNPSLGFVALERKNMNIKTEFGLIIPLKSSTDEVYFYENKDSSTTLSYDKNYTYQFSIGWQSRLILTLPFNEKLSCAFFLGISQFAQLLKSSSISRYEVNGQNQLEQLSIYDKESKYVINLNQYNNNELYNPQFYKENEAKEELFKSHDFSNLQIGFNFIYTF